MTTRLRDEYNSESKAMWGFASEIVHAVTDVLDRYGLGKSLPEFAGMVAVAKKIAAKRWKEES